MKILLSVALSMSLIPFINLESSTLNYTLYQQNDTLKVIEKVYLHTDRYSYFPGDDIWFKAYLVEGSDRILTNHSNNLHVELIAPDHKILDTRTVRMIDGLGNGDFHLSDKIGTGYYRLRAYTNYMRNFGEDLFFDKEILVVNSVDSGKGVSDSTDNMGGQPEIQFFPESGSLADNVSSVIAFKATDSLGRSCDVSGNIITSDGTLVTKYASVHDGMGKFSLTPERGKRYIATTGDRKGEILQFDIPASIPKGFVMSIARNDGRIVQLIFRTNDATLNDLADRELKLSVSYHNTRLCHYTFRMNNLQSVFTLPADSLPEGILMLTLTDSADLPLCERLIYISKGNQPSILIETSKREFNKRDSVSLTLIQKSVTSSAVTKVYLSLSATDELLAKESNSTGSDIASWFLLESDIKEYVEDAAYYFNPADKDRLNNLDLLLMTQGWRDFKWKHEGKEFPSENGFIISGRVRKKFLDVPLKNSTVTLGIFGKGRPYVTLLPIDSATGIFSIKNLDFSGKKRLLASVTDEKDRIKGLLIIDTLKSLPPIVQKDHLWSNHNRGPLTYAIDFVPEKQVGKQNTLVKYIQYYEYKAAEQKKYRLSDTIRMGEITVTAKRIEVKESARTLSRRYLGATPDREIVVTPEMKVYTNALNLLENRVVSPKGIKLAYRPSSPIYLLDGNRVSEDMLSGIPVNMLERIDVLYDPASYAAFGTMVSFGSSDPVMNTVTTSTGQKVQVMGSGSSIGKADGVVSIILKWDFSMVQNPGSVNLNLTGYDEPRMFYSPKHHVSLEKDYKPDLRNTLFWEPNIIIEGNKDQVLSFYNSDNSSVVKITVEGLTSSGIPVTASTRYTVR